MTQYRAFISYSHNDRIWANWLHRKLESYRIPKQVVSSLDLSSNRLTPIFIDREDLPSSFDLGSRIEQALVDSEYLIVICSPAAVVSKWVNEEIKFFKSLDRAKRVLCLIVEGEPGSETNQCFPDELFQARNDQMVHEPLAADVRSERDGRNASLLKIASGILNVGYDSLRQREQQRRNQRLLLISTAAVCGMFLTTFLAVSAVISRNQAEEERLRAEQAASIANEVTDFMVNLFENADPVNAGSGDLTVREILNTGSRNLLNDLQKQPLVRARLLETMGRAYTGLGDYESALRHFDDAIEIQQAWLTENEIPLVQSRVERTWLLVETGEYDEALSAYEGLGVVSHWEEWEFEKEHPLIEALNGYGVLLFYLDRSNKAIPVLRRAVQINEQLGLRPELAVSIQNLAVVLNRIDNIEAAQLYEKAIVILETDLGLNHPQLVLPLINAASTFFSLDQEKAIQQLERAARIVAEVYDKDHPISGRVNNARGRLHMRSKDYEEAIVYFEQANSIWETAFGLEHDAVGANLQYLARCYMKLGFLKRSKELYEKSVYAYNESLGPEHPDSLGPYMELADVLIQLGEKEKALPLLRHTMDLAKKFPEAWWSDIVLSRGKKLLAKIEM